MRPRDLRRHIKLVHETVKNKMDTEHQANAQDSDANGKKPTVAKVISSMGKHHKKTQIELLG